MGITLREIVEDLGGGIQGGLELKAVQIGVSAWTAEALKNTMPASVFSRSTESHNQDKVSMGTIAARDCLRILQLTEQVASAVLLASVQGLKLRIKSGEVKDETLTEPVRDTVRFVHKDFAKDGAPKAIFGFCCRK